MAQGRKRKAKSTTPPSPAQSQSNDTKKGKDSTHSSPRRPNESKTGTHSEGNKAATRSSPRRPNDSKTVPSRKPPLFLLLMSVVNHPQIQFVIGSLREGAIQVCLQASVNIQEGVLNLYIMSVPLNGLAVITFKKGGLQYCVGNIIRSTPNFPSQVHQKNP